MSDRKGSFILAPSKFGKPPGADDEPSTGGGILAKPKFTGFKQSKLGVLAESKLSSLSSPTSTTTFGSKVSTVPEPEPPAVKPSTFSFAPLSKPGLNSTTTAVSSTENTENISAAANTDTAAAATNVTSSPEAATVAAVQSPDKKAASAVLIEKPTQNKFPVFGENLRDKAEIVGGSVFGENLVEKVLLPTDNLPQTKPGDEETVEKDDTNTTTPEKKTEIKHLGFSSVSGTPIVEGGGEEGKTLSESAAELTEQTNSNKRKYDEVAVVTGEEEESNVLKCNVKLYLFDKENRNWTERGRGVLRLNDSPNSTPGHIFSRLVMRTHGSLRVVLNTKLWPEMVCEKVNDKNIRISAWDDNIIKIFLINCSQKEGETLHHALECRLNQLKQGKDDEEGEGDGGEGETSKEEGEGVGVEKGEGEEEREESGEPSPKKLAKDNSSA